MLNDKRNRATLKELAPRTYAKAKLVYEEAVKAGCEILIYDARRTLAEQKQNVANGVSQTLRSYHLVGQAFDAVPIDKSNGKGLWGAKDYRAENYQKFVRIAKKHGFVWGGDWASFPDMPHFQYEANGYGNDEKIPVTVKKATTPKVTPKPVTKPAKKSETFGVKIVGGESKSDAYKVAEFAEKLGYDAIVVKE